MAKPKDWWKARSEKEKGFIVFAIFLIIGIALLYAANWASLHNGSDVWVVSGAGLVCIFIAALAGLYSLYSTLKNV